ncbi:MAG: NUDIX domain-containing protein [Alphaproteobacteria bacterium]|nr:NUDIX domain-containing protein [Alphaproteobacteria bacterium]
MAFWIVRADGAALLRRRPEKGLLGGMVEIPSTEWREGDEWTLEEAVAFAPARVDGWTLLDGTARHVFTHFRLEMRIALGRTTAPPNDAICAARGICPPRTTDRDEEDCGGGARRLT